MKFNLSKLFILSIMYLLLGQVIPIAFISLDLGQLGLAWSVENALDIYKSQTIYPFSSVIFPIVLGLLNFLFLRTRNQKAFYQNILDQMNECIMVFDKNQTPLYENKASKMNAIRAKLPELMTHKRRQDVFKWASSEDEITHHFLVNFKYVERESNLILILKDVSELKNQEEFIKLQELTITRNSKLASLGEIAAGISHEINNPLAVIIGNAEMLEEWIVEPSQQTRKALDNIARMGKRITNIIKLMKNLSREDQNNQIEMIEMSSFMEDMKCLINISVKNSCIEMTLDIPSFKDECIMGSSTQLSQVIINMINNAVQAIENEDEKWIKVQLVRDPDFLTLEISNSGTKIPKHVREKIFQPFFTTKDPGKGTGLGLSISKTIIEGFQGSLDLDDKSENTTFIIKIPKIKNAQAA
jgi:signal transduction histidine kinase